MYLFAALSGLVLVSGVNVRHGLNDENVVTRRLSSEKSCGDSCDRDSECGDRCPDCHRGKCKESRYENDWDNEDGDKEDGHDGDWDKESGDDGDWDKEDGHYGDGEHNDTRHHGNEDDQIILHRRYGRAKCSERQCYEMKMKQMTMKKMTE